MTTSSGKGKKRRIDEDEEDDAPSPAKRAKTSVNKDPVDKLAPVKSRTDKAQKSRRACAQSRKLPDSSSAKTKGRHVHDEEEEEDAPRPLARQTAKSKGKKRPMHDEAEEETPEPLAKRAKAAVDKEVADKSAAKHRGRPREEENTSATKARAKLKDAVHDKVATGKKRNRERDEEASPEEGTAKSSKRKKVVQDQEDEPPAKTRKEEAKTSRRLAQRRRNHPVGRKPHKQRTSNHFFLVLTWQLTVNMFQQAKGERLDD